MRVFFYHYHKQKSKAAGKPQLTIHYKNQCLTADNVVVKVPTYGRIRKSQPYFVMAGKCSSLETKDGIAYIS